MLPKGIIVLWYGSVVTIPAGWVLCDGDNDTPNLENRFVKGATGVAPPGSTGGSATHDHTFTGDGHTHEFEVGTDMASGDESGGIIQSSQAVGTTNTASSLPPWYALAYIMKT